MDEEFQIVLPHNDSTAVEKKQITFNSWFVRFDDKLRKHIDQLKHDVFDDKDNPNNYYNKGFNCLVGAAEHSALIQLRACMIEAWKEEGGGMKSE